uniref:Uncharacterized protein n=1 Tax=Ciona intestinalis TaxID=7719 RepID=H2XKJ3_CIOIN
MGMKHAANLCRCWGPVYKADGRVERTLRYYYTFDTDVIVFDRNTSLWHRVTKKPLKVELPFFGPFLLSFMTSCDNL